LLLAVHSHISFPQQQESIRTNQQQIEKLHSAAVSHKEKIELLQESCEQQSTALTEKIQALSQEKDRLSAENQLLQSKLVELESKSKEQSTDLTSKINLIFHQDAQIQELSGNSCIIASQQNLIQTHNHRQDRARGAVAEADEHDERRDHSVGEQIQTSL